MLESVLFFWCTSKRKMCYVRKKVKNIVRYIKKYDLSAALLKKYYNMGGNFGVDGDLVLLCFKE